MHFILISYGVLLNASKLLLFIFIFSLIFIVDRFQIHITMCFVQGSVRLLEKYYAEISFLFFFCLLNRNNSKKWRNKTLIIQFILWHWCIHVSVCVFMSVLRFVRFSIWTFFHIIDLLHISIKKDIIRKQFKNVFHTFVTLVYRTSWKSIFFYPL